MLDAVQRRKSYLFLLLFTFILSSFIQQINLGGDFAVYQSFNSSIAGLTLFETYAQQRAMLTSVEPGYSFIVWAVGPFLDHDQLTLSLNLTLTILAALLLRIEKSYRIFWLLLLTFGFYGAGLMFAAERLKIAIIVFLAIMLLGDLKVKLPFRLFLLSVLPGFFHLQMFLLSPVIVMYAFIGESKFNNALVTLVENKQLMKYGAFISLPLVFALIFINHELILMKLAVYNSRVTVASIAKFLVLFAVGFSVKRDVFFSLSSAWFLIAVLAVGSDRILFMYIHFILFIAWELPGNVARLARLCCVAIILMKTPGFYVNVFACGNPFVCSY